MTVQNYFAEGTHNEHVNALKKTARVLRRPQILRQLAEELQAEAHRLKREADTLESMAAEKAAQERRNRLIRRAAEAYARTDDLTAQVNYLNAALEPRNWEVLIQSEASRWRYIHKIQRNREIVRLARRGWTNAELAAKFGLTGQHISRIISVAIGRKHHL